MAEETITLPIRIVGLMLDGFNAAGDGGMDPFTRAERKEVHFALKPHEVAINDFMGWGTPEPNAYDEEGPDS